MERAAGVSRASISARAAGASWGDVVAKFRLKHLHDYFAFQIGKVVSRRGFSLNCSPRLGKNMPSNCGALQA